MSDVRADDLVAALRRSGMRVTAARRAICSVLAGAPDGHLSPAEIHARAARLVGDLNQSTVYRTLDALERVGHLHHVHLGHGPSIYHVSPEVEHYHLVCGECGRTVEVGKDELDLDRIASRHGFVRADLHFALQGTCGPCGGRPGSSG